MRTVLRPAAAIAVKSCFSFAESGVLPAVDTSLESAVRDATHAKWVCAQRKKLAVGVNPNRERVPARNDPTSLPRARRPIDARSRSLPAARIT